MLTDFQKKKLELLFRVYDADYNGTIDGQDFELAVDNLRRVTGASEDSEAVGKLRQGFADNWVELKAMADTDGDGKVTLEEWYAHNGRKLETEEGFNYIAGGLSDLIFELFDADHNDAFSLTEYRDFCWAFRLRGFSEEENFKHLCPEGESFTRAHFLNLIKEFFGNDPDAPGNSLFGPI